MKCHRPRPCCGTIPLMFYQKVLSVLDLYPPGCTVVGCASQSCGTIMLARCFFTNSRQRCSFYWTSVHLNKLIILLLNSRHWCWSLVLRVRGTEQVIFRFQVYFLFVYVYSSSYPKSVSGTPKSVPGNPKSVPGNGLSFGYGVSVSYYSTFWYSPIL